MKTGAKTARNKELNSSKLSLGGNTSSDLDSIDNKYKKLEIAIAKCKIIENLFKIK